MEHGEVTGSVFIDLSKAFDCVDHVILLEKFKMLNMSTSLINWFKSYLSGRSQPGMLTRIRDYVTQSSLHTLFVSLVMPTLEYCCTVWGGRYISHDNILNKCLKRAARMILKCTSLTPSADTFARLNWVPLSERVKYKKATLVFKCLNKNLLTPFTQIRETRQSTNKALKVPFAKKECFAKRFAVSGANIIVCMNNSELIGF